MSHFTFAMIKSGAIARCAHQEIIDALEFHDFQIMRSHHMIILSGKQITSFYHEHLNKPYWHDLSASVGGSVTPMLLYYRHGGAVERLRQLMGATDPKKASVHTLRYRFGNHAAGAPMADNAIHGSDSEASLHRELAIMFPPSMGK